MSPVNAIASDLFHLLRRQHDATKPLCFVNQEADAKFVIYDRAAFVGITPSARHQPGCIESWQAEFEGVGTDPKQLLRLFEFTDDQADQVRIYNGRYHRPVVDVISRADFQAILDNIA